MSSPDLFERTLNALIASGDLAKLFVWANEPSRFSFVQVLSRADGQVVVNVFQPDGQYDGLRILEEDTILEIGYAALGMKSNYPEMLSTERTPLYSQLTEDLSVEAILEFAISAGLLVEIRDSEMNSQIGFLTEFDESSLLLRVMDEERMNFEEMRLIFRENVQYIWLDSIHLRALTKLGLC